MQNEPAPSPAGAPAGVAAGGLEPAEGHAPQPQQLAGAAVEIGGPPGPEPTRFGDWEKNGRCIDF